MKNNDVDKLYGKLYGCCILENIKVKHTIFIVPDFLKTNIQSVNISMWNHIWCSFLKKKNRFVYSNNYVRTGRYFGIISNYV